MIAEAKNVGILQIGKLALTWGYSNIAIGSGYILEDNEYVLIVSYREEQPQPASQLFCGFRYRTEPTRLWRAVLMASSHNDILPRRIAESKSYAWAQGALENLLDFLPLVIQNETTILDMVNDRQDADDLKGGAAIQAISSHSGTRYTLTKEGRSLPEASWGEKDGNVREHLPQDIAMMLELIELAGD